MLAEVDCDADLIGRFCIVDVRKFALLCGVGNAFFSGSSAFFRGSSAFFGGSERNTTSEKRKVHINKQYFVWQLRGLDGAYTRLFTLRNQPDANDGALSIKEFMRESEKYKALPLLKRPWRYQHFAWNYKGRHTTPTEWIAAMAPTKLFTQGGESIDGGAKSMDFMYVDSQILELVREYPDVYGEKDHGTYFADPAHISLDEVAENIDARTLLCGSRSKI